MNWKRGLLRAWIIGSVIWIALVIGANWSRLMPSDVKTFYYDASSEYTLRPDIYSLSDDEQRRIVSNEKVELSFPKFSIVFPLAVVAGQTVVVLRGKASADAKPNFIYVDANKFSRDDHSDLVNYAEMLQDQWRRERDRSAVTEMGSLSIVPPLAVLILGYLGGWILRGFRRAET